MYSGAEVAAGSLARRRAVRHPRLCLSLHGERPIRRCRPVSRCALALLGCGGFSAVRLRRFLLLSSRRRPATGRSSSGSIPASIAARRALFYEASTLGNFCAFFLVMIAVAPVAAARRSARLAQGAGGRRRGFFDRAGALLLARIAGQRAGGAGGAGVAQPPPVAAAAQGAGSGSRRGGRGCSPGKSFRRLSRCTGCACRSVGPVPFLSHRRRALRTRGELAHPGGLDRRPSMAGAVGDRLQDPAVQQLPGCPGGGRQHVPQPAGRNRHRRAWLRWCG